MRVPPSAADPRPPRPATGPHPPAAAGKGFGTPAPDRSDKKKAARRDSAPPVDAATAARGRVDVVAVESWAVGADVGELKVKRFSPDVKEEGNGAAATPSPLYETLARRLATLQASGALTRPRAPGQPQRAALPPFEAWAWEAARYASFLAATAALHAALDAALATAVGGGGSTAGAPAALARLGPASALARGAAAAADAAALAARGDPPPAPIPPSIAASCRQLEEAGRRARAEAADAAAGSSPPPSFKATHRLFAAAYALHVTHLTTGMRIGAAAAPALGLFEAGAVALYRDYPENLPLATAGPRLPPASPGKRSVDPLRSFRAAVDAAGADLGVEGRAGVEAALADALLAAAELYEPLAVDG